MAESIITMYIYRNDENALLLVYYVVGKGICRSQVSEIHKTKFA